MEAAPTLRVRTVTAFVSLRRAGGAEAWEGTIARAAEVLSRARTLLEGRGFEVQTVRLATQNFASYLDLRTSTSAAEGAKSVEEICQRHGITFISIGGTGRVLDDDSCGYIPEILAATSGVFCNVQIDEQARLQEQCEAAASCVSRLARGRESEASSDCFRFTVCSR